MKKEKSGKSFIIAVAVAATLLVRSTVNAEPPVAAEMGAGSSPPSAGNTINKNMPSHVDVKGPENHLCKKLIELSGYRKKSLQKKGALLNSQNAKELKDFVINSTDLPETGSVSFSGIDIDHDGQEDSIIRSCGSGIGRLCTLFIQFSSGGKITTDDIAPFYLGRLDDEVYMIEETNGRTSPYTSKSAIKISSIQYMSITPICE